MNEQRQYFVHYTRKLGGSKIGEHNTRCPACNFRFTMRVGSTIEIDAIPRRDNNANIK